MKGGHGATIQASHGCKPVGVSAANVSGITHSPTGEHSLGLEFKHSALSSKYYALCTTHYALYKNYIPFIFKSQYPGY